MLVLGVDPGSVVTGYGLVEKNNQKIRCVDAGVIRAPKKQDFSERIHRIYRSMVEIMSRHQPREMAIEEVFFAKNPKSALKIGHARGAVLIAAVECGIQIYEYAATEIKQSVVGYGRASKEQVRSMVGIMLKLDYLPVLDTSDALAAAICHLNWQRYES